jgi:putative ABC transport system permease protein
VTGAAVAVGIVAFAGTMSGSIRATATAKTLLGPGAEQVIRISSSDTVPPGITDGGRSTVVTRLSESGVVVRGHPSADVLGVDPATFADAAYWDGSFAGPSLGSLLGRVAAPPDGAALPVIAVGDGLPEVFVLTLPRDDGAGDVEVDVRVVGRAEAFPGLGFRQDRPLVVVDRAALAGAGVTRPTEIWTSDRGDAVADRLAAAGVQVVFRVIAGDATAESGVRAQLWTVSYLELIGLAAALVTLAGLGLYFAASLSGHRLGSVVAQRLGMRRRTSAAATALEVGAMLVAGWLLGSALAWVAARLVYTSFDPRPNSPPHALFRPGLVAVGATGVAAIAVALGVALVIERGAARRTLQGMLRDAE